MEWVNETLYEGWRQGFRLKREVVREQSAFQNIVIFESWSHGHVMMLDGVVQITEADEFAYQEMITHVPLIQHGSASRVLIVGGGDGGVLKRVLQHRSVTHVVLVEIDEAVIRLAKKFMPTIAGGSWQDSRAQIVIGDGISFVSTAQPGSFDVIIVDSTDPTGPGESLFTRDFYIDCARLLTPTGIIVNQSGVPFLQSTELTTSMALRHAAFKFATLYLVAAPTYIGGFMVLGFASNVAISRITGSELATRARVAGIMDKTKYWTPEIHNAAFSIPPYILDCLSPSK